MNQSDNTSNEAINQTDERLTDLPVTQAQAEEAKGGKGVVPTDQISVNFKEIRSE